MKKIKRWATSISTNLDWMISQFENHEAMVMQAIREIQEASARAKVQLKKVRRDGENLRTRLASLEDDLELWKQRAIQSAKHDESRAIECLRKRKAIEKDVQATEVQVREHARIEQQLVDDLKTIEKRLQELKRKRNLMRTRESRAEALKVIQAEDASAFSEIDDIFDRWEIRVTEHEIKGECSREPLEDELEREFLTEEEENALQIELQMILEEGSQSEEPDASN